MKLREQQEQIKAALLQPFSNLEKTSLHMFEERQIPCFERLKIYHNNTIGSISNALAATFPLLEKLLGEDFLKSLTRVFVIENPPQSGCLNLYGAGFENFIAQHPQTQDMPYLSNVVRLELAMNDAAYAPDDKALDINDLSFENLEDVTLSLRTSARLITSHFPLLDLRAFCLNPETIPPNLKKKFIHYILVLRPYLETQLIALKEEEYSFLENVMAKKTLGNCLEENLNKNSSFDFSGFLQKHLTLGTFQKL